MTSLKNILFKAILFSLLMITWLSCKDDENDQLELSRMFKPALFEITEGETEATVLWSRSLFTAPGEVEYLAEISKDAEFTDVEISKTTTEPGLIVTDTEIDIKTDYYLRVKALGRGGADDSNWLITEPFQITGQIFILPVQEYDVVTDAARIKWEAEDVLTKITITPQSGAPFDVTISAAEASAGEKTVGSLTPNTNYTVEIFKGEITKGIVTFRTKDSFASANVIDLRNIKASRTKVLGDTLRQIPSGSVILLKRGRSYTIDAADPATSRTFDRSVTIVSGPDFIPELATIRMTTNFNIVVNSVIDSIVFKDVNVKGVRPAGASFDNDYILNVNVVGTMKKVRLENCRVSRLRGTVRLQTGGAGAKILDYRVHNCVIDSIREFSIVQASAASSFTDVKITNSTFTRCRRFVTHAAPGNNSIAIENCTINDAPSGGPTGSPANYFIDLGITVTGNPPTLFGSANPIILKNCIIGKTWAEIPINTDAGGIRANASTTVSVVNTYTLSDFVSTNPTYQLSGVNAYPGTSTSVFLNPANKDFHIKDPAFPGATSAGDPRWR
jgi:hypothetical protein